MKVTDYLVDFLIDKGVTDVFGYPGGVITHFMDSASKTDKLKLHCCYHEQAAAFAACSYAQATGNLGVAFATSGPGALNLVTGIANAYFDSIPTIFITGQVDTYALKGNLHVRQRGFQETDIVAVTRNICKKSILITALKDVEDAIAEAYNTAISDRPGPVILDFPADIQRGDINILNKNLIIEKRANYQSDLESVLSELRKASRPVILAGAGIKQAKMQQGFRSLVEKWRIPFVTSLPAIDLLQSEHEMNMGFTGVNGQRYSNYILAKSDLVITLGARLDNHQIGGNRKEYCKASKIIRIDIDAGELEYKVREDEISIQADLQDVIPQLYKWNFVVADEWLSRCKNIRNILKTMDKEVQHKILYALSNKLSADYNVTIDVGQSMLWVAQSFCLEEGQNMFMSAGLGSMGYSLPAALGVYYATHKPVLCINGDGGIQMNLQELQFIKREKLPIKVVVLNNRSLGMIRQFQEKNFSGNYVQTVSGNGYAALNIEKISKAYDLQYFKIETIEDLNKITCTEKEACVIEIVLPEVTYLNPNLSQSSLINEQIPLMDEETIKTVEAL